MKPPKLDNRNLRKPRRVTRLGSKLERNLLAYSAAAGAACIGSLCSPPAAEGKIVYKHVNVKLQPFTPFALDFNRDGKVDFFLLMRTAADTATRWQYPVPKGLSSSNH